MICNIGLKHNGECIALATFRAPPEMSLSWLVQGAKWGFDGCMAFNVTIRFSEWDGRLVQRARDFHVQTSAPLVDWCNRYSDGYTPHAVALTPHEAELLESFGEMIHVRVVSVCQYTNGETDNERELSVRLQHRRQTHA